MNVTSAGMDEPSKAAKRVLLGTGFGLILLCGLAIIEGRMQVNEVGIGHLFLITAIICLTMSKMLDYQTSFLSEYFPNETEKELKLRVDEEMNQMYYENRVGNAWAELESKVLATEIGAEE